MDILEKAGRKLISAVREGNESGLSSLLSAGVDPNWADADGWTALMWAAREGRSKSLQALLLAGANPSQAKSNGWTALHLAAGNGKPRCCRLLLDAGSDFDAKNEEGKTPDLVARESCTEGKDKGRLIADMIQSHRELSRALERRAAEAATNEAIASLRARMDEMSAQMEEMRELLRMALGLPPSSGTEDPDLPRSRPPGSSGGRR